ncbi:serpin family protein [Paenibacillus filicis]|uniref:Serpin family protein n=2 Tax=Paenibacillus filicis TaxID=669464 RepID=A0ABU9DHM4_9BACL
MVSTSRKRRSGAVRAGKMMKVYTMVAFSTAVLLLAACGSGGNTDSRNINERKPNLTELEPAVVRADNRFGLELYLQMNKAQPEQNVVMSPYSVAMALAMVQLGAEGSTREELDRVLHTDQLSPEARIQGHRILRELLEQSDSKARVFTANSLWIRKGATIKPTYIEQLHTQYAAEAKELDFSRGRKAVQTINDWVSRKTDGKIGGILEEPVSPQTLLYIVNTFYFNGKWQHPFPESQTKPAEFAVKPDKRVQVPMMKQRSSLEYTQTPDFQWVRLPYGDGKLSMAIVLPAEHTSVNAVAEKLSADTELWNRELKPQQVLLELPRFKLEGKYSLNDALQKLGLQEVFDAKQAQFGGISDQMRLSINQVLHKTYLQVDEKGTVAAAVTSAEMAGSAPPASDTVSMTVNRPFIVAIQSTETGSLLFLGTIRDPLK